MTGTYLAATESSKLCLNCAPIQSYSNGFILTEWRQNGNRCHGRSILHWTAKNSSKNRFSERQLGSLRSFQYVCVYCQSHYHTEQWLYSAKHQLQGIKYKHKCIKNWKDSSMRIYHHSFFLLDYYILVSNFVILCNRSSFEKL